MYGAVPHQRGHFLAMLRRQFGLQEFDSLLYRFHGP
jgi:hypothetical protein